MWLAKSIAVICLAGIEFTVNVWVCVLVGMSNLKKLASGIGWGTVSVITITLFQLVFMAVMARLLEPADFGLVAIANVSLRFFSYFAQMGIGPALIQKPTLDDADVRAALALSLGVSSLFFLLALVTADYTEKLFEMSELALVIKILAINFLVVGFSSISLSLMRRNNQFKALAVIEIISYVCGYGLVGLGAAYYGAGVWALVAAFLTQTMISAILSYSVIRHSLSLVHTTSQRSHFFSFGGRYSIIGFIEFLASNVDAMIIGKLMGATSAGHYNRALLLANMPVQQPANVLTKVLFPVLSSIGDQRLKQSISFQLSVLLVGSYAFAVSVGIYIAALDIVKVLLGDKWLDTIPILKILAWSVGPLYISHVAGVSLDSTAQLRIKIRIQLLMLILLILLLFFGASSGKVANIAIAVVATEWVRLFLMGWILIQLLQIAAKDAMKIISCIVIITITTAIAVFLSSYVIAGQVVSVFRLFLDILAGILGMIVGLLVVRLIISDHPAILFMANRVPRFANLLRK